MNIRGFDMQDKFDLLVRKYPEDRIGKEFDDAEIKELQDRARALRKENNELVYRIWAIEAKLNKSSLPAEIVSLSREKEELTLRVENEKYAEKIASLVDEINRLAGVPKGHNNSPSELYF
jgi:hypothetical protein